MSLPRVVIQSLPFEEGFQLKLVKNLFKGNYVEYERVSDKNKYMSLSDYLLIKFKKLTLHVKSS